VLGPEVFADTAEINNASRVVPWSQISISQISTILKTNPFSGLNSHDAQKRLSIFGQNTIYLKQSKSFFAILMSQFKNYLMKVLMGAAGLSFLLGEIADGFIIISIIFLESFLQSLQEYKAEQALEELGRLSATTAKVLRGGRPIEIPSYKVVPGDVLELEAGCKVPADCRIIEAHDLEVVEAALTGESLPVPKAAGICPKTQVTDIWNMAFMGSFVVKGRGRCIAVATGSNTQMGRIGNLLLTIEEPESLLQQQLDVLGRKLTRLCIGFSACIAFFGILHGQALSTMLRVGTSLAVSIVPKGCRPFWPFP
jgi:Ca2+-transporting ATPase